MHPSQAPTVFLPPTVEGDSSPPSCLELDEQFVGCEHFSPLLTSDTEEAPTPPGIETKRRTLCCETDVEATPSTTSGSTLGSDTTVSEGSVQAWQDDPKDSCGDSIDGETASVVTHDCDLECCPVLPPDDPLEGSCDADLCADLFHEKRADYRIDPCADLCLSCVPPQYGGQIEEEEQET